MPAQAARLCRSRYSLSNLGEIYSRFWGYNACTTICYLADRGVESRIEIIYAIWVLTKQENVAQTGEQRPIMAKTIRLVRRRHFLP